MTRALALALAVAIAGACGGGRDDRVHRSGSAAPVVRVAEPVYADGGSAAAPARRLGDEPASTHLLGDEPASTHLLGDEPASTHRLGDEPASTHRLGDEPASTHRLGDEPASTHLLGDEPASTHLLGDEPASTHLLGDEPASTHLLGDEVEPNDGDDDATALAIGGQLRGKLDPVDTDVDRFRIDVARPGELAVFVVDLDGDVVLEIEDPTGTIIARSARGGHGREGVPNLGVSPGRYVAVVRSKPRSKPPHPSARRRNGPEPAPPAITYRISAALAAPEPGSEREPDDDRATATDLLAGDRATGYLGWERDVDVWKLSVEGMSGKTALDIDVAKLDGVALELEVADAIGQPIASRKVRVGAPAQIHGLVPVVPAGGSPFHYLTLRGSGSNPDASYELSVRVVPLPPDAEVEPDDTPEHPFEVPPELAAVAATWTPGDVDCFLIASDPTPHSVDVAVEPAKGLELVLEVLADGKVVAGPVHAHGPADRVVAKIPGGARTIVRVRGGDQNAVAGGSYKLRLLGSTP